MRTRLRVVVVEVVTAQFGMESEGFSLCVFDDLGSSAEVVVVVIVVVITVGEAGGVVVEVEATGASTLASSSVSGGVGMPSALLSDSERCMIIAFGGIIWASVAISFVEIITVFSLVLCGPSDLAGVGKRSVVGVCSGGGAEM